MPTTRHARRNKWVGGEHNTSWPDSWILEKQKSRPFDGNVIEFRTQFVNVSIYIPCSFVCTRPYEVDHVVLLCDFTAHRGLHDSRSPMLLVCKITVKYWWARLGMASRQLNKDYLSEIRFLFFACLPPRPQSQPLPISPPTHSHRIHLRTNPGLLCMCTCYQHLNILTVETGTFATGERK